MGVSSACTSIAVSFQRSRRRSEFGVGVIPFGIARSVPHCRTAGGSWAVPQPGAWHRPTLRAR
jgi:hypothetical protein